MRWRFGIFLTIAGCIDAPAFHARPADASIGQISDASAAASAGSLTLRVEDERGVVWPDEACPRRPVLVVEPGVSGATESIFLFRDEADPDLLDDLERPPLLVAHQARRVDATLVRSDARVVVRPTSPLAPGATYTLAIGAWATMPDGSTLPGVVAHAFRVGTAEAGAVLSESFPASGTSGVDPSFPRAWLRFDDRASGVETISLSRADGTRVHATAREVSCAGVGFSPGTCVEITPTVALAPRTEHVVAVPASVLDRGGAPIGPTTVAFTTGDGPPPPVALAAESCALDERRVAETCVLVEDVVARITLRATAPVRAFVSLGTFRASAISARGDVELRIDGASPSALLEGTLRLVDLSDRSLEIPLAFTTLESLPDVVIDEVRADARGAEPAQEYVELWNRGSAPLDLGGFRISDRADLAGDALPSPSWLPSGGRALVVADAFDPNAIDDGVVPAGVPLFRIGSSIASSGLANAGEPLFLRDASGRRIAEARALAPPSAGVCVVRRADASRLPREGDYVADPDGGCSPGTQTPW